MTQQVAAFTRGRKKVYVDVPQEVSQERNAYFEAHKDLYQKLGDIAPQADKDLAKTASALVALRSEHMRACGAEACAFEPLYRDVTTLLFQLRLQQDDPLQANAESRWIDQPEVVRISLAGAIFEKQLPGADAMMDAFKAQRKMQSAGLDEKARAAALHGVDPVSFGPGALLWPGPGDSYKQVWALRADGETRLFQAGVVSAVKKNGNRVTLELEKEPAKEDDGPCVPVTRVAGLGDGGILLYDKGCPLLPALPVPGKLSPVTLDEAEAGKIEVGEITTLLIDAKAADRPAAVFNARKAKKVVQIRADRVKPAP